MNKTITNAVAALRNNPTDTTAKETLTALALPKFKELNGKVQSAVRTINRHIGEGKGNPNRAKLATAIGFALNGDFAECADIGNLIGLPEMATRANLLTAIVTDIANMRKTRTYAHLAYLPDFLTDAELAEKREYDAKVYLANIVNGVNRAVTTINRHIGNGDFGPNTFKIAKAIGYADEIAYLRGEFTDLAAANGKDYTADLAALDAVEAAIKDIADGKAVRYRVGITPLADYEPFPCAPAEDEDAGEDENEDEE